MNKYFLAQRIVFLLIMVSGMTLGALAQTETNVEALLEFARIKKIEAEKDKAEAIEWARQNNMPVRQVLLDGTEIELMAIKDGRPIFYITDNYGAAVTTRADKLWPGGSLGLSLDGSGYDKLGVWDCGDVLLTHDEFTDAGSSRVYDMDGSSSVSDHATHVSGTLIAHGVDGQAKGMGYNGELDAYEWTNDETEMAVAAAAGMEISNHSYSTAAGWYIWGYIGQTPIWRWAGDSDIDPDEDYQFGFYDLFSQDWDQIAYDAPYYLIVKSAGNDRGQGPSYAGTGSDPPVDGYPDGYDCIAHQALGKNVLTVGAVSEVLNYAGPASVAMSDFSSWGPVDDGRIKPDIVAKGVDVYSCVGTGNSDYDTYGGTSMASPNTAGTLALLQKYYQDLNSGTRMRAATLKALAIHTADECGSFDGPDYRFGWGLVNAERAAYKIKEDDTEKNVIDETTLSDGSTWTRDVTVSGNSPLRVTIVWTDIPGTPVSAALDPPDIMLVNDLDLSISDGSKATYYPYSLDQNNPSNAATATAENDVDNVEMVYIDNTTAGTYTITVDHDGTLSSPQAFSIVISGINEFTTPPACASSFTSPGDAATDVPLNPTLMWSEVGNADSYILHIGSDGGGSTTPTNVLNGCPVGTNSYDVTGLDPNTTYYVQVFPQNNVGTSSGCSIWSFTTLSAITLPYTENWDGVTVPNTVAGWTTENYSSADWVSTNLLSYSGSNCLICFHDAGGGLAFYTAMDNWHFTPPIYMVAGNEYDISFYQRIYNNITTESFELKAGLIASEYHMIQSISNYNGISNTSFIMRSSSFIAPTTNYYYFGFHAYSSNGLGIFIDNLSISETDNTSTWDGSETDGDWTNTDNWSSGVPVDGDHAIIPGSLPITNYPTIQSGDGAHVDYITIEDGGSLIGAEHLTVDGSAFMQRYFSPYSNVADVDGWHIISSPMQGMPITGTDFVPGSWSPHLDDLFVWDENDYYWRNYKVHYYSPFLPGKGYLHSVETGATKEFYGDFNIIDLEIDTLSYTPGMGDGYHMIGNPYQSALIWNDVNWELNNVMEQAKILKNDGTGYEDLGAGGVMAANQGFFIKLLSANYNLTIPLLSRVHSDIAFQKSSSEIIKLKAILEDDRYISINIGLNNQATLGFDAAFDGYHMSFTGIADMYSYHEGDRLSTNYIPYPDDLLSLPVIFHPYQNRDYVMKAENIELVLPEYEITLEDKKASQVVDLRETEAYAFSSNKNDDPERFVLHLKNATGIRDGLNENGISMYMENKELNILVEQPVQGQVSVINAMGQIIYHGELERKGINRYKLNVSPGAYLVRVLGPGLNYTGKIAIR